MKEEIIAVERRNTNCDKWDSLENKFGDGDLIAMWVADMDFKVPNCVIEALKKTVDFGVFGYYKIPDNYFESFIAWEKGHHGYEVKREWIRFAPGVVPAINWMIQLKTKEKDGIMVLTPVYYPFLDAVKNNGRVLVQSNLVNDGGRYTVDCGKFERDIIDNHVKLLILSSPHNPVGRVWKKEELKTMLEICRKRHVFVISDEIHHDMIVGEREHTPTATIGEYDDMLVTITAATKTFNLAGLQNSFVIIPDETLREQFDHFTTGIRIGNGNMLGYVAVEAAYQGGASWLEGVLDIIRDNYAYIKDCCEKEIPEVVVSPLEGTYLAWLDLSNYVKAEDMKNFVQDRCRLAVDYGDWFGGEEFSHFIRLNLATSKENVKEAMENLVREIKVQLK